jgi:hypothetical protein
MQTSTHIRIAYSQVATKSIAVTAPSKTVVCGRSLAGIADSNPVGGMDVCLLRVLCFVTQRSLRRADHSSRGDLVSVVSLCVIEEPHRGSLGPQGLSSQGEGVGGK